MPRESFAAIEARTGLKAHVKWRGNTKTVSFTDTRLSQAIERVQAERWPEHLAWVPDVQCGPVQDWPGGNYAILSRSDLLGGKTVRRWHVRMDTETGEFIGPHTCDYRAARGDGANVICRHIAIAWLCWQSQRLHTDYPFLGESGGMTAPTETLTGREVSAYVPQQAVARWEPDEGSLGHWLALASVLKDAEGHAIPKGYDTAEKIATVLMAADAIGLEPKSALLTGRVFLVNGKVSLDGQAMGSLVARYGGQIEWQEITAEKAKGTIHMPGKGDFTYEYEMADAVRAGLAKSEMVATYEDEKDSSGRTVWKRGDDGKNRPSRVVAGEKESNRYLLYPKEMLTWKCVERLVRFGAPEVLNAVKAVVERPLLQDFEDRQSTVAQLGAGQATDVHRDTEYDDAEFVEQDEERTWSEPPTAAPATAPAANSSAPTAASAPLSPAAQQPARSTETSVPASAASSETKDPLDMRWDFSGDKERAALQELIRKETGSAVQLTGRSAGAGEKWLMERLEVDDLGPLSLRDIANTLSGGGQPPLIQPEEGIASASSNR